MDRDVPDESVVRFDVVVRGASYRALVEGLRSPHAKNKLRLAPKRPIKAEIELDVQSKQFSLNTLGRHRLPKALCVQPGSRSHANLTNYLAAHLSQDTAKTISDLLSGIAEAAPIIHADALKLFREDIHLLTIEPKDTGAFYKRTVFVIDDRATEIALDIDDLPPATIPLSEQAQLQSLHRELLRSLRLEDSIRGSVTGNVVEVSGTLHIPASLIDQTEVFLHWGSYDESSPPWQDEIVTIRRDRNEDSHRFLHRLYIPTRGSYGITAFAQIRGTTEPVWLGKPWVDDIRITIASDDLRVAHERAEAFELIEAVAERGLSDCLHDLEKLSSRCDMIATDAPHLGLGALIARACSSDKERDLLTAYSHMLAHKEAHSPLKSALLNYGIGEVVFATPEGPHAAAGGLAQVISGLPPVMCEAGIPITIIAPLYAHENGNRHSC